MITTKKKDQNRCELQIVVIKIHKCTEGSLTGRKFSKRCNIWHRNPKAYLHNELYIPKATQLIKQGEYYLDKN